MPRSVFNMTRTFAALVLATLALPAAGAAQQAASRILSSEIGISRDRAEIQLELEGGRKMTLATVTGTAASKPQREVTGSGDQIFTLGVARGDATDRSWRELLNQAIEASPETLPTLLAGWNAPGSAAAQLDAALEHLGSGATPAGAAAIPPTIIDDSVVKLETRIQELERELDRSGERHVERDEHRGPAWAAPFRRIWHGINGIFATLITYLVLFGIGLVAILFGGRKYLEGVADTVRAGVGRAFLVGLAGSFLLIPVFVLGIIALAISIVGIPALLVWVPLFPVGAVVAVLLGFLGVAHATGESWAERNYYGSDWFRRGNSYYFLMTGLILLGSLFLVANIIYIAGPWLNFINGVLNFFGIVLTWGAATVGFGAVLISRGGSRPANGVTDQTSLFTEDANV
jgi:hypothetical protein